jgi:hypothetical protein
MTAWKRLGANNRALVLLSLGACSGSSDGPSIGMGVTGDPPVGTTAGTTAGATGDPNATGNPVATIPDGGGTPNLEVTESFIWIANTDEGTVSKLDTRTMEELGRYITSPLRGGKPSRTSVGPDGSVVVANRGGTATPRVEAGITKIYSANCPDTNGDGTVTTSTGKSDVKDWLADECVAWHVPLDYYSNRPVAWAPVSLDQNAGDGATLWTAGSSDCPSDACNFDVLHINGDTGDILQTISVGPLSGSDFITGTALGPLGGLGAFFPVPAIGGGIISNYGPYGGATDGGGNFWTFTANTTTLVRVSFADYSVKSWDIPNSNGYGITVGSKGRVFVCGVGGVSRFNPADESWATSPAGGVTLGFNGCMTDGAGTIWVGGGVDSGDPGLHAFNTDSLMWQTTHSVGEVKGVSVDIDGFVWGVGAGGASMTVGTANTAFKVHAVDGLVDQYDGLNAAYSYSDMTGFGLAQAGVVEIF